MKIKKNDNVIILTGKDKGKKAKVLVSYPKEGKILVEGVNMLKRRQKPKKSGQKGQVLAVAMPINMGNVSVWCENCGKGVRTGSKVIAGKKVRVCKKCDKEF